MAVAVPAPAADVDPAPDNPRGAVGRPAGPAPQASDVAPAGGPPVEQAPAERPPPLEAKRKAAKEKIGRPAYWDADMSGGAAAKEPQVDNTNTPADRPGYWDADMSTNGPPEAVEPAAPAPPEPPGFAEQAGTRVMAGGERMAGAAQDISASGELKAHKRVFWQAMVIQRAMEESKKTGRPITEDPEVQLAARHLREPVSDFASDLAQQTYGQMPPEQRQATIDHAKQGIQDALGTKSAGDAKRLEAQQMEQSYAPGFGEEHPVKNFALDLAGAAPELIGAIGAAALPGGQAVAASMFVTDFGLRGWSQAKDAGADDDTALTYAALQGAAGLLTEIPVIKAVHDLPLLQSLFSKVLRAGGVAVNQGAAMAAQRLFQIGLDKGLLDINTPLTTAFSEVAKAGLMGLIVGPLGAAGGAGVSRLVHGAPAVGDALSRLPGAIVGRRVVDGGPANDIERAESAARAAIARMPDTDQLDQEVAATHAAATVGAHHDAAAVQAARELEHTANQREIQRQQAEQADADHQADIEQGQRESGLNQAATEAAPETTPEQAFAQREQEQVGQKEADFIAAKNQQGEQAVQAAQTEDIGAEKGGANEPRPTLAEALPPEQLAALQSLKARRAAEAAKAPPAAEPTVAERLEAQNPEDAFQKLGPEVPSKTRKEPERAVQGTEKPLAPVEEGEPPESNPPPITAQTLAERRQAALDAAKAAKLGIRAPEEGQTEPKPVTAAPEQLPKAVEPPNRLAAIRAAEEKRQAAAGKSAPENRPQPVKEEKPTSFAARRAENDWITDQSTRETAEDVDRATSSQMGHDEAHQHLAPLSDAAGPRSLQVHDSHNDDAVPEKYKVQIDNYEAKHAGSKIKGFFDPDTGVAHVFADAHKSGEGDDIRSTAVHELTHKGLDAALGKEGSARFRKVLGSLANDIKDTAWAKDLIKKRGYDLSKPDALAALGNEYAAHMAENIHAQRPVHDGLPVTTDSPTHWQRIVDAVRAGLRKLGIVKRWTDQDVAALIRNAHAQLGGDPIRASLENPIGDDRPTLFSADSKNEGKYSDAADWGPTVEEQMPKGYKPSAAARAAEVMRQAAGKSLKLSFLHNLPDFLNARTRPLMPSPERFVTQHDKMEATRGAAQAEGAKLADRWEQHNLDAKDGGENLFNTMHNNSNLREDPSKPHEPPSDPAKQAEAKSHYETAADQYKTLTPVEKKLYSDIRDQYTKMLGKELKALEARINDTGAAPALKEKFISLLRKQFEPSGRITPYFPLGRGNGDFWGVARDTDGKTQAFVKLDSANQLRAWKTNAEKQGFTTEGGQNMDSAADRRQLNPKFASEVADMARDISPEFGEEVWQHYLRSMPEIAGVKRGLPRKGVPGYTQDALYNFKNAVSRHSMMLARLEHSQKLSDLVESTKNEARAIEQSPKTTDADKAMAPAMAKEIAERHDLITNPKAAGWIASKITRLGYAWYLWWSPATAYRIGMQNPLLARPLISKQFGPLGASREMWNSFGEWAARGGTQRYIDSLRGDERTWAEHARDVGVITNTFAKTLLSGGPRPAGEVGQPQSKNQFMRGASAAINSGGWLFNAMEQKNRITSFMAAYRLGVKSGMSPEDAASSARAIVRKAHVDYSLVGRPSVLQGSDLARVVGQFKLYPAQVAYQLFREFRDATRRDGGVTPQQRLQSTRAFASIIGRGMLLGGVRAVPLYWVASGLVNTYMHHEGDDKFDMTQSIKQHLTAMMGETAARTVMHGPASVASGYNAGSAADYSNLFFKSSEEDKNWAATLGQGESQLAGSLGGLLGGFSQAADTAARPGGDLERAAEQAAPTELANLLKANRFWREGALNMRGEPVVSREDIGTPQAAFRALGFTPEKLLEQYETNTAFENAKKRILDHKASLENGYERAVNEGNTARQGELLAEINQFNAANEGNRGAQITARGVVRSMIRRAKAEATAVGGVDQKGFEGLAQEIQ